MRVYLCLLWTLQTVFAQTVQIKDPSVCDNAKKRYGVGFNPHPNDCTQFVQCFYYRGNRVEPVYRSCEFGQFWEHSKLRCEPSHRVKCPHDKCKPGVKFYKHSDLNKCGAYWECINGKAYARCCSEGNGFHPTEGCIPKASCVDMCPLRDRVPGCGRRPISGSATNYEQYTDNGIWKKERCPPGRAYNPADCECSLKGVIKADRECKPDVHMTFNGGTVRAINRRAGLYAVADESGNGHVIKGENVQAFKGALYFRGNSKLSIEPLKPSPYDEGVLIVKMKFKEDKRRGAGIPYQALLTNGHCGEEASVLIAKIKDTVLLGAEANFSRSFPLPIVNKPWKEIIYIHDQFKLEGRVCGATYNNWCIGALKPTSCGFQFGLAPSTGFGGFVGLMDEISIYRCKPLDAVINLGY